MTKIKLIFLSLFLFRISAICIAQDFWLKQDTPEGFFGRTMTSNSYSWIFIGTNDGVYYSTDNGENISKLGLNNVILSITTNQENEIFSGSGSIYLSQDNGSIWSEIITPTDVNTIFVNEDKLLYGYWGGIFLTLNIGVDWNEVLVTDNSQVVNSIVQKGSNTFFAGATGFMGGGGVYRSIDGGINWAHIGLSDYYIQSLAIDSNGTIFAGSIGNNGIGIYKSIDNGDNWTPLKTDVCVSSIIITINDVIYIGCSNENGTQGGVFRSNDNGETWELLNSGLLGSANQNVYGLCFTKNGYLYCYGEHLHRSSEPIIESIYDCNHSGEDFSVFPNPANDFLFISSNNQNSLINDIKINIYDSFGRCVYSDKTNQILTQSINISNFASGLYSVKIEYNNNKKIIKTFIKLN